MTQYIRVRLKQSRVYVEEATVMVPVSEETAIQSGGDLRDRAFQLVEDDQWKVVDKHSMTSDKEAHIIGTAER